MLRNLMTQWRMDCTFVPWYKLKCKHSITVLVKRLPFASKDDNCKVLNLITNTTNVHGTNDRRFVDSTQWGIGTDNKQITSSRDINTEIGDCPMWAAISKIYRKDSQAHFCCWARHAQLGTNYIALGPLPSLSFLRQETAYSWLALSRKRKIIWKSFSGIGDW